MVVAIVIVVIVVVVLRAGGRSGGPSFCVVGQRGARVFEGCHGSQSPLPASKDLPRGRQMVKIRFTFLFM
jgi:hypothetical protein